MKRIYLTIVGYELFLMVNANKGLTNKQCNSTIFSNKEDADLNTDVFHYFNVTLKILNSGRPLDMRTKKAKQLEKTLEYFSVSYLPEIQKGTFRIKR